MPATLTEIGEGAFMDCRFKSVSMPENIKQINPATFVSCSQLETIDLPEGLTTIGRGAFGGCIRLRSIQLPKHVTQIEAGAFNGCSSLESITIPEGVTVISRETFADCESLTSIDIPGSITDIGVNAFKNCSNLDLAIPNFVEQFNLLWKRTDEMQRLRLLTNAIKAKSTIPEVQKKITSSKKALLDFSRKKKIVEIEDYFSC